MNRSTRLLALPLAAVLATAVYSQTGGFAQTNAGAKPLDRQAAARQILEGPNGRYLTAAAQMALRQIAGGGTAAGTRVGEAPRAAAGGAESPAVSASPPRNVRVNNPATDRREDQTTQSETSMAVSGSNVAVGFNDSQHSLLRFTAGTNLNGYGYSTDGGQTFSDGGVVPNAPGAINLGDPWLASARSGTMYYGSLLLDDVGNVEVGVARSTNGGKAWGAPVPLGRHPNDFYSADKDAITAGRDPRRAGQDNVYAAWDDLVFSRTGLTTGLPVAHSTDGGQTWKTVYADRIALASGCSFTQYIGAQPVVDPVDGTLYVAAEKISVIDPHCIGTPARFAQVIFTSHDGGESFRPGRKIAAVTPAGGEAGAIEVAPGRVIRTIEFPSLAVRGGTLYVVWNDGSSGHSHVAMARSADRGLTWARSAVTGGGGDDLQPALTADASGLHVLFYRVRAGGTVLTDLANSTPGGAAAPTWTIGQVSSVAFQVPLTSPNFDPIIAPGYMGDYIANVSDGTHQYLSWGDNRDIVKDDLFPAGRVDPDVFFARQ